MASSFRFECPYTILSQPNAIFIVLFYDVYSETSVKFIESCLVLWNKLEQKIIYFAMRVIVTLSKDVDQFLVFVSDFIRRPEIEWTMD